MFSADSCGGWGVGLAARAAIQLGVDAVGVVILANSAVQAIQPHQESVPLPQPTVEVSGVPLQDQTPHSGWLTSFDAPPQQQVLADPLPTAEKGSNIVSTIPGIQPPTWRGGLRNNLQKLGSPPATFNNPQAHHNLPWKFRDWFAGQGRGLNVNDPQFGRWVEGSPQGPHQNWTRAYEDAWTEWIGNNQNASQQDTLDFLNRLLSSGKFPSQ